MSHFSHHCAVFCSLSLLLSIFGHCQLYVVILCLFLSQGSICVNYLYLFIYWPLFIFVDVNFLCFCLWDQFLTFFVIKLFVFFVCVHFNLSVVIFYIWYYISFPSLYLFKKVFFFYFRLSWFCVFWLFDVWDQIMFIFCVFLFFFRDYFPPFNKSAAPDRSWASMCPLCKVWMIQTVFPLHKCIFIPSAIGALWLVHSKSLWII